MNPFTAMRALLQEATQLGVTLRISGADVAIDGMEALPGQLQEELRSYQHLLWIYLGGEDSDEPSLELARQLGVEAVLIETVTAARFAVRQLLLDMRVHGGHLAIDTETAPLPEYAAPREPQRLKIDGGVAARQPRHEDPAALDPHRARLALLQIYAGGETCFVFRGDALRLVAGSRWLRRQHLIAHNAGFESAFLARHAPRPASRKPGRLDCSMQATGLVTGVDFNGSGRSLASAAEKLLGVTMPKELATSDWSAETLSPGQLAYAAVDAIVTWRLWPMLLDQLRESGCWEAYSLQRGAIPAVTSMGQRGLGLDREEHARQAQQWSVELEQARQDYQDSTGNIPPHTPDQRREWLQTVLSSAELASWPLTETDRKLSTAEKHLKRLAHIESARPVLRMMAHEKLISSFGPNLVKHVNPVTHRLHCSFSIAATKAGRFSARNPNLQQLPGKRAPEFRRCIRAAPGNVLISCDWNQVELRAAAWISGDYALTVLYRNGEDLHAQNAAAIAGVPLDEVTSEQRAAAKAVSFGSLYGIGPRRLVENAFAAYGVEMTIDQASRALDTFFSRFPQLAMWRDENARLCQSRGFIRIGAGRLVKAEWEPYGLSFPQCCNLPIQGICADAMLRALALVHSRMSWLGGGLVATVHDELLLEVPEDDADLAEGQLQDCMIQAFEVTFPGAPTTGVAVAKVGKTWADVK